MAMVTGAGVALPPARGQDELWDGFFAQHYRGNRWAHRVFTSTGVASRHCAVDPVKEDVSAWSTGRRMVRYVEEAVPLAADAVAAALGAAGMDAAEVGMLAVVSCTGYATPGVDIQVAAELGFSDSVQRLLVGHMGCYGALPGLGAVADYVTARGRPAVLACVELSSLHLQPAGADVEQVVAHGLFGDAAAAVVVEPGARPGSGAQPEPGAQVEPGAPPGLAVVDVVARTDPGSAGLMTWDVTDLGFRMGLSRKVPDVLGRCVGPVVAELLGRNGVDRSEVGGWAVHPGGPRILDVVGDRLGLADADLAASRQVLADAGNCSSATVLLVLEELRRRPWTPGRYVVALAFGPGLTLYAALLRST